MTSSWRSQLLGERRLIAWFTPILFAGLVAACRDDPASPEPDAAPAFATSAAALVFTQVSAGGAHTCGVTSDNKAYCWGANGGGRLGDGSTEERHSPVPVAGGLSFRQVSAGQDYVCGLTTENLAYCWGSNTYGQLGNGSKNNTSSTPVAVAGGRSFLQIRAGADHTCAVNGSGVVFCWGRNSSGELGDGTTNEHLTPVRVQAGGQLFSQIAVGYYHSCALGTNALVYCWGANFKGQLGDGTTSDRLAPKEIRGGRSFSQVRAGPTNTCGVTTGKAAYCWGSNQFGQIGNGTSGSSARRVTPTAVLGGLQFRSVSPGGWQTCGVTAGNRIYCWGANNSGQLGTGTTDPSLTPVAVTGGLRFDVVGTGYFHTCGITLADRLYCWGFNESGRLGDGTTEQRLEPVPVAGT